MLRMLLKQLPEVIGDNDTAVNSSSTLFCEAVDIPESDARIDDSSTRIVTVDGARSTELDPISDLYAKVLNLELPQDDSEGASETKDYSDDFDSTDSHSSWDAVNRLKLLQAPVLVVQTDSELEMAVSDNDEPMMKLDEKKFAQNKDLDVDLDETLVFKAQNEYSENISEASSKKLDEILAETVAELGLPHLLVTTPENGASCEVKEEYSDDFDSEDKSFNEDDSDRLNVLNVPDEEVKTDSEMELGTSDQEAPMFDLDSSALIKDHEGAPIIHKPPTHPETGYFVIRSYKDEDMYSDDFDSDSKISDDDGQNKLRLLNIPVEVVNTDQ